MGNWNADNLWSIRGHFIIIGSIVYEYIQIPIEYQMNLLGVSQSHSLTLSLIIFFAGSVLLLIGVAPVCVWIVFYWFQIELTSPQLFVCTFSRDGGRSYQCPLRITTSNERVNYEHVYAPSCIFTMRVQQVIVVFLLVVVVVFILLPFNVIITLSTKKLCVDLVKSRSVAVVESN